MLIFPLRTVNNHMWHIPAGIRSLKRAAHRLAVTSILGTPRPSGYSQSADRLVLRCTALDTKLYSRKYSSVLTTTTREASLTTHATPAQITFGNASARLEQKPLSLPDSALALATCDGSELTALDTTSTSKRRAKPPILRGCNRPFTAAVRRSRDD